ncbi:MAG: hypothetical protein ACXVCN_19485, partial [Bdellovibrio sp.]
MRLKGNMGPSLIVFGLGLFISVIFANSTTLAEAHPTKVISDSLVQNLECHSLNVDNIYKSIRDDAFDISHNIPIKNWSFQKGSSKIAGCWALSRTQRMISYLARYNTPSKNKMESRVVTILDMIRGASLIPRWFVNGKRLVKDSNYEFKNKLNNEFNIITISNNRSYENILSPEDNLTAIQSFQIESRVIDKNNNTDIGTGKDTYTDIGNDEADQSTDEVQADSIKNYCERKLRRYNVFAVEESNLSGSMIDSKFSANLWENLQIGYNQFFGAVKIQRN